MPAACPNGHQSTTSDYCDQCGAKLDGAPDPGSSAPSVAAGAPPVHAGASCPNCQSPSGPQDKFCEVCGYDFVAGTLPVAPIPSPAGPPPGPTQSEPAPASSLLGTPVGPAWTAVVSADRAYYDGIGSDDMPFPDHCPERTFTLTSDEILIGRRSESRGIHPQVDLTGAPEDTGISRSHVLLRRQADGTFAAIDPGSTNGTFLNDVPIPLAHDTPVVLADGDRMHIGGWTKIVFHAPPAN